MRRRRTAFLVCLAIAAVFVATASAHNTTGPPLPKIEGPFTIKGRVLDPKGNPVAGYPLRLYPVLPNKGTDRDNSFYKIPDRDDHFTKTDADGNFVMTNVIDYPQVTNRVYKLHRGDHGTNYPFVPSYQSDVIALDKAISQTITITIKMEPAAIVRIVVKDSNGKPFSGSKTVSIATGHGRRYTRYIEFKDGVGQVPTYSGDLQTPGRIVLLRWENTSEARKQAKDHGKLAEGQGRSLILYGIQAQKQVLLVAGQTVTVEFVVDE